MDGLRKALSGPRARMWVSVRGVGGRRMHPQPVLSLTRGRAAEGEAADLYGRTGPDVSG